STGELLLDMPMDMGGKPSEPGGCGETWFGVAAGKPLQYRWSLPVSARKARTTMYKLVLVRHGESVWNKENRFTGWTDVDLSEKGRDEAREGGVVLKSQGYTFDVAYTSVLKRAIRTLWMVLDEMDLMWIPVHRSWRLNERH